VAAPDLRRFIGFSRRPLEVRSPSGLCRQASTTRFSQPEDYHEEDIVDRSTAKRAVTALTLMLLVAPASLRAQIPGGPAAPSPEVQGWIAELQDLQARLGPIQREALQDESLRAAQMEVSEMVQQAVAEDPALADLPARAADIQARADAAVQDGNEAQLQAVMAEAQQLEQRLAMAQNAALERPEIAARMEAFQARLQGRMIQIEPEAEVLIQRFEELQMRVAQAMARQL
jgi:hypothetical protein